MRPIQMVDLKTQYQHIKDDVDHALQEVIDSAAFIQGKAVQDFARSLEAYLDIKHVIPCANGTDALQIVLMALDLQPGDEVICHDEPGYWKPERGGSGNGEPAHEQYAWAESGHVQPLERLGRSGGGRAGFAARRCSGTSAST